MRCSIILTADTCMRDVDVKCSTENINMTVDMSNIRGKYNV